MLIEVRRFHRRARHVLTQASDELTLGDFLVSGGFSDYFIAHFMVPMVASVWSASPSTALTYPARYLFAFLDNHGMLSITGSPAWRTVTGGSRTYVEKAVKHLSAVATATPVRAVIRHADGVEVRDDSDQATVFDRVVVATHADTALAAAGRSLAPGARRRWVRSATPETKPGCTPTTTCSRPRPAPGRRGTTCSRPATPARTASWSPTT